MEIPKNAEDRFTEVLASYKINRICNYVNRKKYKEHIAILTTLLKVIDEEYLPLFVKLFEKSCNEQILGASKKEIFGAMKYRYEKPIKIAEKIGISPYKLNNTYRELLNRDFMTSEWLNSLEPVSDEKTLELCKLINSFTDNFNYLGGEPYYEYYDHFRSLELEFYLIYRELKNTLGSSVITEKFIYTLCNELDLSWGTISHLLRHLNEISRSDGIQAGGDKQLKLEVFNLAYLKGFNKGDVSEFVFKKKRSQYYTGSYDYITKNITKDEWEFSLTYTPTTSWESLNKDDVLKFIDIFRNFTNEKL